MRAIVLIFGILLAAHVAHAESVVVMSEPSTDFDGALRVAMASRGVAVASAPVPMGTLRLERAAYAQRMAVETGAEAAVWLDEAEVCAVSADGHDFRHAPFPAEAASPRAFAAIATSLLDEIIHPAPWMGGYDVNVNVEINATDGMAAPDQRVAFLTPPGMAPDRFVDAPLVESSQRAHAGQTLFELGPSASPITAGVHGAIAFPLTEAWRLAGTAALHIGLVDNNPALLIGSVELRHVGAGLERHWDVGPEAGYATAEGDAIVFGGVRFARTWEGKTRALSLAFTPLIFVPTDHGDGPFPGIYTSMRWQFPL